jgi:hypothetical protein
MEPRFHLILINELKRYFRLKALHAACGVVEIGVNSVSYGLARMRNWRPDIGFHFVDGTFPGNGRRQPAQAHCSNNQRGLRLWPNQD